MHDINAAESWSTEDLWLKLAGKVVVLTTFKHFAESTSDEKWPIISKLDFNFPYPKACAWDVGMPFFVTGESKSLGKCSSVFCSQWQFVLAIPFTLSASFLRDYPCCCCSSLTSKVISRPNLWYVRQYSMLHELTEGALTLSTDL